MNLCLIFPGGVCVRTSRNSEHRPLQAVSQKRAKRQAVQCRTLCELSDEHHRNTEYRKDWKGIQLGRDWTSLVETINGQRERLIYSPLFLVLNLSVLSKLCNKLDFTLKRRSKQLKTDLFHYLTTIQSAWITFNTYVEIMPLHKGLMLP